jgi:hypothetical protein
MIAQSVLFKIFLLIQVTALAVLLRAPCIFRPNEPEMHKYSAILATTQPFRASCIEKIKNAISPLTHLFGKLTGMVLYVLLLMIVEAKILKENLYMSTRILCERTITM